LADKTAGPKNVEDKKHFINALEWFLDGKNMEEWKEEALSVLEQKWLAEIGVETVEDDEVAQVKVSFAVPRVFVIFTDNRIDGCIARMLQPRLGRRRGAPGFCRRFDFRRHSSPLLLLHRRSLLAIFVRTGSTSPASSTLALRASRLHRELRR